MKIFENQHFSSHCFGVIMFIMTSLNIVRMYCLPSFNSLVKLVTKNSLDETESHSSEKSFLLKRKREYATIETIDEFSYNKM